MTSASEAIGALRVRVPSALAVPLCGALLGLVAIGISRAGVGDRPALAVLIVLVGIAAAAVPPAYGLPVAVVLACFEGLLQDFFSPRALYWNEAFTTVVVARSLLARRPTRVEAVAAGVGALALAGYLATGTSLETGAWGAKVLLTSAVAGWALARIGAVGAREWRNVYLGLAVATAASVVLAVWQRAQGVAGLQELGLVYGQRVREVGGGTIRVFAGFTSAAPLSYMLAISLFAWCAYALGSQEDRANAVRTGWLPAVAFVGIALTVDRTAVIASAVALVVLAFTYRRRAVAVAAVASFVALGVGAAATEHEFDAGIGGTLRARASLWWEYMEDLRPLGRGPASAGSAYDKVAPGGWHVPLRTPNNWEIHFDRIDLPRRSGPVIDRDARGTRPTLVASAQSLGVARRLSVWDALRPSRILSDRVVPAARPARVALPLYPERSRDVRLVVVASLEPTRRARPGYGGRVVNLVSNPSLERDARNWVAYQGSGGEVEAARDETSAAVGSWSLKVEEASGAGGQGAYFNGVPFRADTRYTASVYLRGERGGEVVGFLVGGSEQPVVTARSPTFSLSQEWRRYRFSFTRPVRDPGGVFLVYSANRSGGDDAQTFFVDGLQVERGTQPSEYCDGAVPHCRWTGARNASPSARAASTRLLAALAAADRSRTEELEVESTRPPLPQRTPFPVTIDDERVQVLAVTGPTTWRVRRGAGGTRPEAHSAGTVLWAEFVAPRRAVLPRDPDPDGPAIRLSDVRIANVAPGRTPAERVWNDWLADTPAALEGDGPGLVDNLYVSWLWQYGLLGVLVCAAWLGILLRPAFRRRRDVPQVTATLVGVFLVVGALVVSVWEESPTDFLAALVLAYAFGRPRAERPRSVTRRA